MSLEAPKFRASPSEPWADSSTSPLVSLRFPWGLNENLTQDIGECSVGYNYELAYGQTSFVPRPPFDLKGTAPNGGAITGIMQLNTRANVQTTLVAAGSTVYQWDGAGTWSIKGSITSPGLLRSTHWSLGEYLVIPDVKLNNVVKTWDGTTFGNMTTGLSHPLMAKYAIVHLDRVWLFNISYNGQNFPHMIMACAFEDPTTWDPSTRGGPTTVGGGTFATGLEPFYLFVPDLKAINGVCLFANQLIISTNTGRLWNLSGSDSSTFQFGDFFDNSPSVGEENVVGIGNDVVFCRQGGAIALLSPTQAYGNVTIGNLSSWIPTTTKNLNGFSQIVYDTLNQKVLFFTAGKVLVLYKNLLAQDRFQVLSGKSPWSVYETLDSSNFVTQAAKFMMIPGTTNYSVYWGDSIGRVFDMNGSGSLGDAGANPIQALRTSSHISNEIINPWPWVENSIGGHIKYRRNVQASLTLSLLWDEEYSITSQTVTLKGPAGANTGAYYGGAFYYGADNYLLLPGTVGNYASTPSAPANQITGDIDIIVCAAATNWNTGSFQDLAAKWNPTGNMRSYDMFISNTGTLSLQISRDGTQSTVVVANSSVNPTVTNGKPKWLRATRASATGVFTFYTSDDSPNTAPGSVVWTQLGTTVSGTAGTLFAGPSDLEAGSKNAGTGTTPFGGKIYSVYLYNGIGGTLAASMVADDATVGVTSWTSALTSEVWTNNGTATISLSGSKDYYNQGFQFANYLSSITADPGGKGPGFYVTLSASSNTPFEVTSVDFE